MGMRGQDVPTRTTERNQLENKWAEPLRTRGSTHEPHPHLRAHEGQQRVGLRAFKEIMTENSPNRDNHENHQVGFAVDSTS